MVYSAVLSHGTSLSAAELSRMVPEVSSDAIRQMMKRMADERKLRLAAVQRAIHVDRIPVELARREDSLSAVSSALTLLTNVLMAWNTTHMQHALEALQTSGIEPRPDQLRRIAPTYLEGINLRGNFIFP
jgi:hypothetical protein